jgi:hypothetical protein
MPFKILTLKNRTALFAEVWKTFSILCSLILKVNIIHYSPAAKNLRINAISHFYGYPCVVVFYGFEETSSPSDISV